MPAPIEIAAKKKKERGLFSSKFFITPKCNKRKKEKKNHNAVNSKQHVTMLDKVNNLTRFEKHKIHKLY